MKLLFTCIDFLRGVFITGVPLVMRMVTQHCDSDWRLGCHYLVSSNSLKYGLTLFSLIFLFIIGLGRVYKYRTSCTTSLGHSGLMTGCWWPLALILS